MTPEKAHEAYKQISRDWRAGASTPSQCSVQMCRLILAMLGVNVLRADKEASARQSGGPGTEPATMTEANAKRWTEIVEAARAAYKAEPKPPILSEATSSLTFGPNGFEKWKPKEKQNTSEVWHPDFESWLDSGGNIHFVFKPDSLPDPKACVVCGSGRTCEVAERLFLCSGHTQLRSRLNADIAKAIKLRFDDETFDSAEWRELKRIEAEGTKIGSFPTPYVHK